MSGSELVISNASDDGDGTPDDGIPDHFKCPICFEVPEREIYQCKNGHIICHKCKNQPTVRDCPQCRVAFEVDDGDLIRNRVLENLLKSIAVPCPFKQNGCQRNISLISIKSHMVNCVHNDKRVQLCKLLGYNCDFWTNPFSGALTVSHFHSHHRAQLHHSDVVHLKIQNFIESIKDMKTFTGVWKPVILYNDHTTVMILTLLKPKANFVSWIILNLTPEVFNQSGVGCSSGFEAEISLKNKDFGCPTLSADLPVVSVLKSAEAIRKPRFRLRIKTLKRCYLDASEILNVFISLKKGANFNREMYVYLRKITPINYFIKGDDQEEEEEEDEDSYSYANQCVYLEC